MTLDGENPARLALAQAQHESSLRLSQYEAEARQQERALVDQSRALEDERGRLVHGEDKEPPAPYQRAAGARAPGRLGAPFSQLVEFRAGRGWGEREPAALEAALEAAGLLDAWVAPDGSIDVAASDLADTLLVVRPA